MDTIAANISTDVHLLTRDKQHFVNTLHPFASIYTACTIARHAKHTCHDALSFTVHSYHPVGLYISEQICVMYNIYNMVVKQLNIQVYSLFLQIC